MISYDEKWLDSDFPELSVVQPFPNGILIDKKIIEEYKIIRPAVWRFKGTYEELLTQGDISKNYYIYAKVGTGGVKKYYRFKGQQLDDEGYLVNVWEEDEDLEGDEELQDWELKNGAYVYNLRNIAVYLYGVAERTNEEGEAVPAISPLFGVDETSENYWEIIDITKSVTIDQEFFNFVRTNTRDPLTAEEYGTKTECPFDPLEDSTTMKAYAMLKKAVAMAKFYCTALPLHPYQLYTYTPIVHFYERKMEDRVVSFFDPSKPYNWGKIPIDIPETAEYNTWKYFEKYIINPVTHIIELNTKSEIVRDKIRDLYNRAERIAIQRPYIDFYTGGSSFTENEYNITDESRFEQLIAKINAAYDFCLPIGNYSDHDPNVQNVKNYIFNKYTMEWEEIEMDYDCIGLFFDTQGGSYIEPCYGEEGDEIPQPKPDPIKLGHNFSNWYKDGNVVDFPYVLGTTQDEVKAAWIEKNWLIIFHKEDKEVTVSEILSYDSELPDYKDIFGEEYSSTFDHWDYEIIGSDGTELASGSLTSGKVPDFDYLVNYKTNIKINLYPVGTGILKLTLEYKTDDDDEFSFWKKIETQSNANITDPGYPILSSYIFSGWYEEETFENKIDFSSYSIQTDATIYGSYKKYFTVNFDTDGGTSYTSQKVIRGEKATRPETEETWPQKEGYYYYTSVDGNVVWYKDKNYEESYDFDTEKVEQDLTLYAKPIKKKFKVRYYNGKTELESGEVLFGENFMKWPESSSSGKKFLYWYSETTEGVEIQREVMWDAGEDGTEVSLYAKLADCFEVSFDPNKLAKETIPVQLIESGSYATEPADPTLKESDESGTFLGWSTDEDVYERFDFGTQITNSIDLYPFWYNEVTFNYIYESTVIKEPVIATVHHGNMVSDPGDSDLTHYIIKRWFIETEEGKKEFDFSTSVKNDIELYSDAALARTVSFNTLVEGQTISSEKIEYETTAIIPDDIPYKTGAYFTGWHKMSEDGSSYILFEFGKVSIYESITLYAQYKDDPSDTYHVVMLYKDNNPYVEGGSLNYLPVKKGDPIEKKNLPNLTWYTDKDCTVELEFDEEGKSVILVEDDMNLFSKEES